MKAGAVEFLIKPFRGQDLLDAIHQALEGDRIRREQESEVAVLREHLDTLSPREREVLSLIIAGRLNKEIASDLGTSDGMAGLDLREVLNLRRVASAAS
jgi:FixJ family two-component response regulator